MYVLKELCSGVFCSVLFCVIFKRMSMYLSICLCVSEQFTFVSCTYFKCVCDGDSESDTSERCNNESTYKSSSSSISSSSSSLLPADIEEGDGGREGKKINLTINGESNN